MTPVRVVDLRSDTVTRPSPAMRRAIAEAEVGDDVLGDDPTVLKLQQRVADLLGKEAALYVPSGTMANLTALRALTEPGDEIIADADSHFYNYESGGVCAVAGCSVRLLSGERGRFGPDQVRTAIRRAMSHFPRSRVVVIENTHNRGGGAVWTLEQVAGIRHVADELGLKVHMDGARLMNACAATGRKPAEYAALAETVSMCFSKGLGAPVGSAVAGTAEMISRVHRFRKMFGGGMRQVGILAAAALYALDHNVDRLGEDHRNARRLAEGLAEIPGITARPEHVDTNILFFDLDESLGAAPDFCNRMRERGVWMLPESASRVRAVTHLDVSADDVEHAIAVFHDVAAV